MGGKKSKMCKFTGKEIENKPSKYYGRVKEPRFACAKCCRVAHDKKFLCKPILLVENEEDT